MKLLLNHFFYNQRFKSKETLFEKVSQRLLKDGYVKSGYCDALISREKEFPTGIESKINLAIPHADPQEVNKSTFVIITLSEPLQFASMVEPDKLLEVQLVILLVLNDGKAQIAFLQRIANLAGDNEMLCDVLSQDRNGQFSFFNNYFSQL
jgi:PTS system galactitol-specific IIA component